MTAERTELLTFPDHLEELPVPHDRQAEESIIGSVLKDSRCMAKLGQVEAGDFYVPRHRVIWRAMVALWERNLPIDYTTLANRLDAADMASGGVGIAELAAISLAVPTAANVEFYAGIVADTAAQRRYIDTAQKISETAWRPGANISEVVARVDALIAAARPSRSRRDLYDPQRWADTFWTDLEGRTSGRRTAVTTGLLDIDTLTLGLEAGGLYLLMGTPGTGKSDLAMQIAMHVGREHGPVLFASLEMSAVELAHRYARLSRGMDRNRLATGAISDDEYADVAAVMNEMVGARMWPASPAGNYTTSDLRADAMEVQSQSGKLALIVADYVQRFRDRASKSSNREENVGMVAENLKSLAREFGCPVLAPVQPNREHVGRVNKRPLLSDLRESGRLEAEADVVLGLYRDEKHNEETRDRGIAEVHMLKNRSGVGQSDGMRKLVWRSTRYDNYTPPSRVWTQPEDLP
jgi:replicative DNA helicase